MIFVAHFPGCDKVVSHPFTPTHDNNPDGANAYTGPFRTRKGAQFMALHGRGNPHCQTVNDAEKLAKKYYPKGGFWKVGRVDGLDLPDGRQQASFKSEMEAAEFIDTLPDHLTGEYYLDPPYTE